MFHSFSLFSFVSILNWQIHVSGGIFIVLAGQLGESVLSFRSCSWGYTHPLVRGGNRFGRLPQTFKYCPLRCSLLLVLKAKGWGSCHGSDRFDASQQQNIKSYISSLSPWFKIPHNASVAFNVLAFIDSSK